MAAGLETAAAAQGTVRAEGYGRDTRTWGAVALVGLVALVVVSRMVSDGAVSGPEEAVFRAFNDLPGALYPLMYGLQLVGVIAIGPLVAVVAYLAGERRLALAAVIVTVAKLIGERLVKEVVERQRPFTSIGSSIHLRGDVPPDGLSYASGHVILTVALGLVLSPYLSRRWRWVVWGLVLGNAVARVYVGAHNPLDVVGGACIGAIIGAATNLAVGTPAANRSDR